MLRPRLGIIFPGFLNPELYAASVNIYRGSHLSKRRIDVAVKSALIYAIFLLSAVSGSDGQPALLDVYSDLDFHVQVLHCVRMLCHSGIMRLEIKRTRLGVIYGFKERIGAKEIFKPRHI